MDRYATILKEGPDGKPEVINVHLMEGVPPELNKDAADRYEVKKSETLRIGMVAGEQKEAVDGFGYPEYREPGSQTGVTRTADAVKHETDESVLPAVSHEKVRRAEGESSGSSSSGATKDSAAAPGGTEEAKTTKGSRRQSKRASGARKGARKASAKAKKKAA